MSEETTTDCYPATTKPDCRKCVHKLDIPGDAHIRCNNHAAKVLGHQHGLKHGWFLWPANFDPVWLLACDGFSDDEADRMPVKPLHPLIEILSILIEILSILK